MKLGMIVAEDMVKMLAIERERRPFQESIVTERKVRECVDRELLFRNSFETVSSDLLTRY